VGVVVDLLVLDGLLRATSKKSRQLFWGKVHPQTKSRLHLCLVNQIKIEFLTMTEIFLA